MDDIEKHKNWLKVLALADEALKRKLAAAKALDLGWGGISAVTRITGMSPTTIRKGIKAKTFKSKSESYLYLLISFLNLG